MENLVSIIMSTYNEPISMLDKSVNSILTQTHKSIQFIIINDNPNRKDLSEYLEQLSSKYSCIYYIKNERNLGLVNSLNKGLNSAKGDYIARMDADDISDEHRLEHQLEFLIKNDLDIVGSNVNLINEFDEGIGSIIVPELHNKIVKYYNYGSGMLHPTWFVKRTLYLSLKGYRNICACEDYDFMLRAFANGYKVGNVPEKLLNYRVRNNGISVSLEADQKLLTYYLWANRRNINEISESTIMEYMSSRRYQKDLIKIKQYVNIKNDFKYKRKVNLISVVNLLLNKYFYINIFNSYKRKCFVDKC